LRRREKLLATLFGPQYQIWRSVRAASPEARAKLFRAVEQYHAIQRATRAEGKADELLLFDKRWDEASLFLIMLYPEPGWLFNLVPMAVMIIFPLVVIVRAIGQVPFWR
jgi:hypothetical protein